MYSLDNVASVSAAQQKKLYFCISFPFRPPQSMCVNNVANILENSWSTHKWISCLINTKVWEILKQDLCWKDSACSLSQAKKERQSH